MRISRVAPGCVAVFVACSPGGVAQGVRPDPIDPKAAMGEKTCRVVEERGTPLIVDWTVDERTDLEAEMKEGVAVVEYTCSKIRVLPDCHADGTYGFVGVTQKEQVVQLKNDDEIRANLPKTGLTMGVDFSAELKRGASLDIAMAIIGKRRTTRAHASSTEVTGDCKGATHFVRGASVGAFAMETGTQAQVRGAVQIFGGATSGASSSTRMARTRDGAIDSCRGATPNDAAPPSACGALIRLELVALGPRPPPSAEPGKPTPDENVAEDASCPKGMVATGGKCALPGAERVQLCKPTDLDECKKQCDKGSLESCVYLGELHRRNADDERAEPLFKKACDSRVAIGCAGLGDLYVSQAHAGPDPENPARLTRSAQAYAKACELGHVDSCDNAAGACRRGDGVPVDTPRALKLYARGCDGGNSGACMAAGEMLDGEPGVTRDEPRALQLFHRACDERPDACVREALMYEHGRGVAVNEARAAALFKEVCDAGAADACMLLGFMIESGRGVPKDVARGGRLIKDACHNTPGCDDLGSNAETGRAGWSKDEARAFRLWKLACEDPGESPVACAALGRAFVRGIGTKSDRRKGVGLLRRACSGKTTLATDLASQEAACELLKELGEKP